MDSKAITMPVMSVATGDSGVFRHLPENKGKFKVKSKHRP